MTNTYDTCAVCSAAIAQAKGRGKAKKYCGQSCMETARNLRDATRTFPRCSVEGCSKPATRISACMCETHYYRVRRTGKTVLDAPVVPTGKSGSGDRKVIPYVVDHSQGYLLQWAPDHPLRRSSPRVYQHRVVFYDYHGEGPFSCKWCGVCVAWDSMHVDHIDDDKQNNEIRNLAASCPTCNQHRGGWKTTDRHRKATGIRIGDETRTINEWAAIASISRSAIRARISKGWAVDRAVFEPRGKSGPKAKEALYRR